MNTKLEHVIEIVGAGLAAAAFGFAALFTRDGGGALFLFFVAGALAGAVLGALGAKAFQLMELGMKAVGAKVAAHLCVVIIAGPAVLDWSLKRFEGSLEPESIASAAGGVVALFGTSLLIMVVPSLAAWAKYLIWKRIPKAPAVPEVNSKDSPPEV